MAAPANNSSTQCAMCGALVPAGALTCPECGAPIGSATVADSENVVYPEIARANLSRMRGDYKAAEDQLLAILRKYPNNPSVNEMLGDLMMEREDVSQAIQWYQLALEIVPTSASIARKLKTARSASEQKDTNDTVSQLGIDKGVGSGSALWISLAIVGFIVVAISAYLIGASRNQVATKDTPPKIINAESEPTSSHKPAEADPQTDSKIPSAIISSTPWTAGIKAKSADAAAILSASLDPRSNSLTIVFAYSEKDVRAIAARIARDAFTAYPSAVSVSILGVAGSDVKYAADVSKAKIDLVGSADWANQHAATPEAWIDEVLANEWPAPAPPGGDTATPSGQLPGDLPATSGATGQ